MTGKSPSRREFLAMIGTATVGGLAGCSGVTDQSFAADPVVLPGAAQDELVLAETVWEGETITRAGPAGIEVSITNQASLYRRGAARGTPTVLERFTSMVNGTEGSGSAVAAIGSDVGLEGVRLGDFEGVPDVRGDQISIILPAGARSTEGSVQLDKVMAHWPGTSMDAESVTYAGEGPGAFIPGPDWFPETMPGSDWFPASMPGPDWFHEDTKLSDIRVFLPNAEEKGYRIPEGQEVSGLGVEQVDPGITIDPAETVFVSTLADFENPHEVTNEAFDVGVPVSLGGSTYGLAALSTPTASVLGQSVNPLVNMETSELLQRDATRQMLARAGVTDADTVEWLRGPEQMPGIPKYGDEDEGQPELLGEPPDLELLGGLVSGDSHPWGVVLFVARVTPDDHIISASTIRRPVGTPNVPLNELWSNDHLAIAAQFTAETMGRLTVQPPKVG